VYDFQYITADSLSDYCSPFVDPFVYRVVSPGEFASHLRQVETYQDGPLVRTRVHETKAVYWFDNHWDYLKKSVHSIRRKNYLFGNFTKWNAEQMNKTRSYSYTIFPCQSIAQRMETLISCYDNMPIYPGSYRTLTPMRCDLLDRSRMAVLLSMCSIQKPSNRLAILKRIENTVKNRNDVFITLLMDGHSFKDERQMIDHLGLEYSDKCLVVEKFSDYEYMNILTQNDVFIDLNPINGVGYLLSAALHRGLMVGGFSQPLYRDILKDGEYGILFNGTRQEYGYGFDHVVPNWDNVFRLLNERVFVVSNILRWFEQRNERPNLQSDLEARLRAFFGMFTYLTNAKIKSGQVIHG